jgi:polyphosphate kinase 2 (PPK2 family)
MAKAHAHVPEPGRLAGHAQPEPLDQPYDAALEQLQSQLAQVMVGHIVHRKRSVVVFEGWDAAGKGGAIKRLTAEWDPRAFAVWPISAPTAEEQAHNFLWRFWRRLPAAGEIGVFDRSWYGRVLVERVEGFASEAEWRRAYAEINQFEEQLAADGTTTVKLFMHVSPEVQDERLKARLEHPWKRWKVSAEDFRNREQRAAYLAAMDEMFAQTDTAIAPWTIINGDKKKPARIAALRAIHDRLAAATPSEPPKPSKAVMKLARAAFG